MRSTPLAVSCLVGLVVLAVSAAGPAEVGAATTTSPGTGDPSRGLRMYGAGPRSLDSGVRKACTGTRASGQQVLCVRAGASGSGTASAPFGRIGAAVTAARDGDVIQVAGGPARYRESVKIGNYGPGDCSNGGEARNVSILGAFDGAFASRDSRRHPTTVSGDGSAPPFVICVMGGRSTVDGFVISTGRRDRGFVGSAGGFSGEGGTLVVSNNVVTANRPPGTVDDSTYGGGIVVAALGRATVEVSDNHVHRNESGRGSGITASATLDATPPGTVKVLRNRVESNTSIGTHGGGMFISGPAEIAWNVVIGNAVTGKEGGGGWGGGFISDNGRPVVAHHNVVTGNRAGAYGNGEFYDSDPDARVSFEFVSANGCSNEPRDSGILVDIGDRNDAKAEFSNITVVGHRCPSMAVGALVVQQGARAKVRKSVFWDNLGIGGKPLDLGVDDTGSVTLDDSVTQQGFKGKGNTSSDPRFIDAAAGDYRSSAYPDRGAFAPGGLEAVR